MPITPIAPTTAELAEAVVASLNAAAFSEPVTATRAYLPLLTLADAETLHVTVVPVGRTIAVAARGWLQHDHRIEVGIQQRVDSDEPAVLDPLLRLAQEIADHLTGVRLAAHPEAQWVATEHQPLIALEHLNERQQFTSLVTVVLRTWEGP